MYIPLREQFLNQYSTKTRRTYRTRFRHFIEYLEQLGIQKLEDVQKHHIETWAREIVNQRAIRKDTKDRTYSLIRQYFEFLQKNKVLDKIELEMRMEFTDFISQEIIERNAKIIPEIFDIVKLIQHAKKVNPRMYIYLALIATNGARDSEIRSIKINDIHHLEAEIRTENGIKPINFTYFTSGTVDEHQKKGQVIYFVHPRLVNSLEWKLFLKQVQFYREPVFLFQTSHSPRFISYKSTNSNVKKYAERVGLGNLRWSTHVFRDVINEKRMDLGCDSALRTILLNQSPRDTNAKHYLKKCKQIQNRYQYWLKFMPPKLLEIF